MVLFGKTLQKVAAAQWLLLGWKSKGMGFEKLNACVMSVVVLRNIKGAWSSLTSPFCRDVYQCCSDVYQLNLLFRLIMHIFLLGKLTEQRKN